MEFPEGRRGVCSRPLLWRRLERRVPVNLAQGRTTVERASSGHRRLPPKFPSLARAEPIPRRRVFNLSSGPLGSRRLNIWPTGQLSLTRMVIDGRALCLGLRQVPHGGEFVLFMAHADPYPHFPLPLFSLDANALVATDGSFYGNLLDPVASDSQEEIARQLGKFVTLLTVT